MNQQEFKQLSDQMIPSLQKKLDEKGDGQQVIQFQRSPFQQDNTLIGITLFEGSDSCEVYSLFNDGNSAYWSFQGTQQFK